MAGLIITKLLLIFVLLGGEIISQVSTNPLGGDLYCDIVGSVQSTVPVDVGNAVQELLQDIGKECALSACGEQDHLGRIDILCNVQCQLAFYSGGICTRNIDEGWAKCTCLGHGQATLNSAALVCPLLANCGCRTCSNGAQPLQNYVSGGCHFFKNGTYMIQCQL